ncbi:MAG: acyl carrier protein [Ruminococcaceae bacterium]|nr:acyl carrier protein [Oscillospiraceae bacterium]
MFEEVKQLLLTEFTNIKPDDVTMDAELVGDLCINSIDLFSLVEACQEKFDVEIDDEDVYQITTVGDIVKYIEANK